MIRHVLTMSAAAFTVSVLMGSSALPAAAQSQSAKVSSWDIDLTSQAGRAQFEQRIHQAIEQVCGPSGGVTMDDRMNYVACVKTARAGAMAQFEVAVKAAQQRKVAIAQ
jgi:UrcA family protein